VASFKRAIITERRRHLDKKHGEHENRENSC
jgi:hypothetical protein